MTTPAKSPESAPRVVAPKLKSQKPPATVPDVIEEELKAIRLRRRHVYDFPPDPDPPISLSERDKEELGNEDEKLRKSRKDASESDLVGMSFSGGGIRSGTFAVGFLQGLASMGLLRRIDYLSTVSGGGYAGGWLAAWLKREGSVANVERQLIPSRCLEAQANRAYLRPGEIVQEEPEPLHHLRRYSSYMAPRIGWLTVDTWTIIAIWTRNVSINMLMLLPMASALVLLARMVVYLYGNISQSAIDNNFWGILLAWGSFIFGSLALGMGLIWNSAELGSFRHERKVWKWTATVRANIKNGVYKYILTPWMIAAVCMSIPIRAVIWRIGVFLGNSHQKDMADWPGWLRSAVGLLVDFVAAYPGILGAPNLIGHALILGIATMIGAVFGNFWRLNARFLGAAFMAGASAGILAAMLEALIKALNDAGKPDLTATLIPPLGLLIIVAAMTVEVGILGRTIHEDEREWWARLAALLLVSSVFWLLAFGSILYVPAAFLAAGLPLRATLTSGWAATTLFGVLFGRKARPASPGRSNPLGTLAAIAPPIFLIGFLGLISLFVSRVVNMPPPAFPNSGKELIGVATYFQGIAGTSFWPLVIYLCLCLVLYRIGAWVIDVNLFSLHAMYANRLIRCYLGASRPKKSWETRWGVKRDQRMEAGAPSLSTPLSTIRESNPVTGFDSRDDIPLSQLQIGLPDGNRPYWGPQLLINTTLNLVGGGELAWRDRKGESFTITPRRCGSKSVGYAEVTEKSDRELTLGRAIAISGAAIDPNMKFDQSASLTAFLTIFNARLGYWMRNPSRDDWQAQSPKFGARLWDEFFGRTDNNDSYVHLSDGGHFENLGVYELVRRRCKFIIAVDAGEDVDASDDSLSVLIRLCRIDFGVRILLRTDPLKTEPPDRLSEAHFVVGDIRYDDVDEGAEPGVFVYVKSSLTGDEPPDLQKYAETDDRFPNQPTNLMQSFDEEQFECYRALGDHISRTVFEETVAQLDKKPTWAKPVGERQYERDNRRLFNILKNRSV